MALPIQRALAPYNIPGHTHPLLTPIQSVLAPCRLPGHTPPQKISPEPYIYLKLVQLRPIAGVGVNFRMRLSDGVNWVHAYFVSTAFDEFVHNGTIKAGQVIEVRRYMLGVHGSDGGRFMGLVWIYPIPQAASVMPATTTDGDGGPGDTSCAVDGPGTAVDIIPAPPAIQKAPSPPPPPPVPARNIWLVSRASLTDDMLKIKRTMLDNLSNKNMRNANFLVVVLERRQRHDSKSIPKQDWYLWDETSNDRRTILSVWGDLCAEFQPAPGTILALWNVQINTRYEDNPNSARLIRLAKGGLGHLNAYKNKFPKGMMEPEDVAGYHELKEAWKAWQRTC